MRRALGVFTAGEKGDVIGTLLARIVLVFGLPVTEFRSSRKSKMRWACAAALLSIFGCACVGYAAGPSLGPIANQNVFIDQPTDAIELSLSDPDPAVLSLQLSGTSSDPALIPNGNIFFGTALGQRSITVTPTFGLVGTATITVTATDGTDTDVSSFIVVVNPPVTGTTRFVNNSSIAIPAIGAATPYPSQIAVSGMVGTINKVVLTTSQFSHNNILDVNMLLVAPSGQAALIFSHIAGAGRAANNVTINLNDSSAFPLPL